MTTSSPPDNTVLVLYPPKVNGQTEPVEGAHIGVPLVAYDLVTDGEGAVVLVDPPLSGTMDPGDVMELWLENEAAALDSETIVDPDARTTLRIPKARLHPDKVNMLYYTVRRGSSNIGTSTPPLEILYNRIRPGLKDRLTDPGGHSELKLLLPDEIKNGVGADFVSAEVCVAYPYCRAYDVISLKCNGELLEPKPKVNPNLAPQPPNPGDETPITICFTVTRAFLDKAKRQDKKLHFSYTVTDQIGNGPDTDAPWSPVQSVDEDLDGTRLPMPILLERKEDYPGDDASIIDLEKLAGNPLLLVVITKDNRFAVGDEIVATYTTTGQTDPVVVWGKVEEDPFIGKLPCFLEVPNDKVFAGSKVTAVYEVHRPNVGLVGNSSKATATVTGSTPIDLLPPSLVAPAINPIDVLAYPKGVTVRIEYLGAQKEDRARLVEVNPPAGSPQFPLVEFNSNKRVNTVLSPAFLAARHGKEIELFWNLHGNGGQAGKSPATQMSVLKIADGDSRLPSPKVPQAPDDKVLDLNTFEGNADVTVLPWIGISTDNIVTLKLLGKATDNSDCTIPILTNHKITEAEKTSGIKEILMREQLLTLKHDTELKVYFEVLPSPASNLAPIIFPPLNLKLLKVPLVMLEDFETGTVGGVPVGTVMDFPSMVVTALNGYAVITTQYYTPPFITGKYLYFAPGGTLRFTLKRPAKSIRFGSADASNPPLRYSCYDENIELVKAGSTPVSERPIDVWVEITETPNRTIKFIDITDGRSGSRIDNFSLYY